MSAIDPDVAASRLRGDTEKIAACTDHPHPASDPVSVIKWVRGVSCCASEELRVALIEAYPTVGWVAEGETPEAIEGSYWIHDAIDGAYHFPQELPLWSSSLTSVNGRAILALPYDPFLRELFPPAHELRSCRNVRCGFVSLATIRNAFPQRGTFLGILDRAVPPSFGASLHTIGLGDGLLDQQENTKCKVLCSQPPH